MVNECGVGGGVGDNVGCGDNVGDGVGDGVTLLRQYPLICPP